MTSLQEIEDRFDQHLRTIDELISFDKVILDLCINHIESLSDKLKSGPFNITNPYYLADNTLKAIKSVRQNNSLRNNYQSIYNSCLVLQVSYFTSILHDIFRHAFNTLVLENKLPEIKDDIKFTIKELSDLSFNLIASIGDLILKKKDISFQDMQSTAKVFKSYLDIEVNKDSKCNTIILAQASRHAIVHSLGVADEKFINQISAAKPRDIKHEFNTGQQINYSETELEFVKLSMQVFITDLNEKIKSKYMIE